jgi:hypothetical protein
VRDTGGGDYGLHMAIERGLVAGPRLFYCGKAISQTWPNLQERAAVIRLVILLERIVLANAVVFDHPRRFRR